MISATRVRGRLKAPQLSSWFVSTGPWRCSTGRSTSCPLKAPCSQHGFTRLMLTLSSAGPTPARRAIRKLSASRCTGLVSKVDRRPIIVLPLSIMTLYCRCVLEMAHGYGRQSHHARFSWAHLLPLLTPISSWRAQLLAERLVLK